VTRGQVDIENNSQSQDLNILNNTHGGSVIYGSGSRALVQDIGSVKGNTAKQCRHD